VFDETTVAKSLPMGGVKAFVLLFCTQCGTVVGGNHVDTTVTDTFFLVKDVLERVKAIAIKVGAPSPTPPMRPPGVR
jgi:hypothetical protein